MGIQRLLLVLSLMLSFIMQTSLLLFIVRGLNKSLTKVLIGTVMIIFIDRNKNILKNMGNQLTSIVWKKKILWH